MKLRDVARRNKRNAILVSMLAIVVSHYDELQVSRLNLVFVSLDKVPSEFPYVILFYDVNGVCYCMITCNPIVCAEWYPQLFLTDRRSRISWTSHWDSGRFRMATPVSI